MGFCFKTNYHSHSEFCDGTGQLEEYVKADINKGFDAFGFSGHAPRPFKNDGVIQQNNLLSYFDETENWHKSEIETTLECIADNKQILEVNTGVFIDGPSGIFPSAWILQIAKNYDIPIIISSDAHSTDRIDYYFNEAKIMAKNAGYNKLKVFIGDKWIDDEMV